MAKNKDKGVSLAKGPVAITGIILLAAGILGFVFAGNSFSASPVDGTAQGDTFLGFEANGWTNLLLIGAGALLLFGSPLHWAAKSLSLIVGLVLGAASVIALADGDDVFGIFAANGPTKLLLGAAAALLIVLALLPRVGGGKKRKDDDHIPPRRERVVERDTVRSERRPEPAPVRPTRDTSRETVRDSGPVRPARVTDAEVTERHSGAERDLDADREYERGLRDGTSRDSGGGTGARSPRP
jgi:hypothetical protein